MMFPLAVVTNSFKYRGLKKQKRILRVLEVRCLNGRAGLYIPLEALEGNLFPHFPAARGCLRSLPCSPPSLQRLLLLSYLCLWLSSLPLFWTLVITLGPPGYSRIIFPFQDPSHIYKVSLAIEGNIHRFWVFLIPKPLWGPIIYPATDAHPQTLHVPVWFCMSQDR